MNPTAQIPEEELHAWLDGELPPEREAAVDAYLAAHPEERERLESYRSDSEALARAFSQLGLASPAGPAPASEPASPVPFRRSPPATERRPRAPWRAGLAVAASVLIGALGFAGGILAAREPPKTEYAELLEEVTSYHLVYAHETKHLVEVPASERGEIVDWLSNRLDRRLVIPDLSGEGLTFAGGRMLVVNNRPVAQLLYTLPSGMPVGVCVTRLPEPALKRVLERRNGLSVASWIDNGYAYVVVGILPEDQVQQISDQVVSSFRG